MATRLAKTLYAKVENPGSEDRYVDTAETIEELAELGETVTIAEYKLVRKFRATTKVETG